MEPLVALVMGSYSDFQYVERTLEVLKEFAIPHEVRVLSAHRSPAALTEFAANAEARGLKTIVAAAGGAAHLAGVVAAHTILPVIGLPVPSKCMGGLDSLLSMSQMPGGIPVSTMSVGSGGPENAALTAIAILALNDPTLAEMLRTYRRRMNDKVLERDSALQWKMSVGEEDAIERHSRIHKKEGDS